MADLEQLKQKYASVLNLMKQTGVRLSHEHIKTTNYFSGEVGTGDQNVSGTRSSW
jgi:hypothetical protein